MEIERKFLVKNSSWKKYILNSEEIVQFYLTGVNQSPSLRLRSKGAKGFITLKYPSQSEIILMREEYEYEIPVADVLAQMSEATGNIIKKTRHNVKAPDGNIWEIDEFKSPVSDLILAEIEYSDEEMKVALPDWAGEEVTTDPRYSNLQLSFRHS
ncbi:MAG: CYTH domain-containing protein [Sneathiella sp.]|nr:CYTH domain-containing protein [Sneathiella sp.]